MQSYGDFIKATQRKGLYVFSKADLLKSVESHESSLRVTLARQIRQGNLSYLGQDLYTLVPPAYHAFKAPPVEWIMDDLMRAHGCQYYVGLLSAAALHGAAHQAPQIFQVICDKRIPARMIGERRTQFYYTKEIPDLFFQKKNTPTGYLNVSTPEATAFDLLKYMKQSGHLNHVATVLSELGEVLKPRELQKISSFYPPAYSQRLGFILDEVGFSAKTALLHEALQKLPLRYVPLRSDKPKGNFPSQEKWHLIINEILEPDDL